jgi:beta-lactamase regulating signal transducer with metallopeptidase domain
MTPFILALLTKLTLILTLGLLVASTFRSSSPSLRHLILFATLVSSLALPVAMVMSPRWSVPVLPRSFSAALSSASGQATELTADHRQSNPSADAGALNGVTNVRPSSSALSARVIDAGATQPTSGTRSILAALPLLPLLPLLWIVGFAVIIVWLAIGRFGLRRIAVSAWPLNGSDWSGILDEERNYAGVTKPVLLYTSSVVNTPLTWGSRAPVVLLPEDALDWPEAHRRIVLRHELAHVARGDSFTQLVAGLVCALYWFHPLAWITERRLRAECERACDDSVVSLGTPAAEYAAHLLEVARSARAFGAPGFLSVAMARPSQLEGRLLAVLNESRRRVSLSRGARPAAALMSALVLLPLAAFRAVPKVDAQVETGVSSSALNAFEGSRSTRSMKPETPRSTVRSTGAATNPPSASATATSTATAQSTAWAMATSAASSQSNASASFSDDAPLTSRSQADTTFQLSVPARAAGTLTLDLKTGGNVIITGWDKPEVFVRASLGGRDWRRTRVTLQPSDGGARLESDYIESGGSQSSHHVFEINVPRNYNARLSSAGGSISITGVDGVFTGQTGGGEINIQKANGQVDIRTGGGEVRVSDSRLNGTVSTGGGIVRIEGVIGDLNGKSGSGPVIYGKSSSTVINRENGVTVVGAGTGDNSITGNNQPIFIVDGVPISNQDHDNLTVRSGSGSGSGTGISSGSASGSTATTTNYISDGVGLGRNFGASGIRMNSAGGGISLRAAPDGARVTTGGGPIRIGPSGGEVYAQTGGGSIDIGPATGSVEAHTGAGNVTIELQGASAHSVDVTSGKGEVVLVVPRDLNAILELETAYTDNLGHKTRIVSELPVQTTETADWDGSEGTPRRYVRARQTVGRGGGVIRVRTVNGDIVLKASR